MNNSETVAELARLRNELEALRQAEALRRAQQPAPSSAQAALAKVSAAGSTWNSADIDRQMKQIAKRVKDETQERPLLTLLAVFAVGILLGRLLR